MNNYSQAARTEIFELQKKNGELQKGFNDTLKAGLEYKKENEQLKLLNAELLEALVLMMDSSNPYSSPARNWRESNFKDGRVGSRGIPSEESIVKAKELILKAQNI